MKIIKFIMKKLLIVTLLALAVQTVFAQQSTEQADKQYHRSINVSFGYLPVKYNPGVLVGNFITNTDGMVLQVDADVWHLYKGLSLGAYIGLGPSGFLNQDDQGTTRDFSVGLHYGVTLNYHLLQAVGVRSKHWDIAAKGMVGSYWTFCATPQLEYGIGVSATWYPAKCFGLFAEYDWGHFRYNAPSLEYLVGGNSLMKCGVSFRF